MLYIKSVLISVICAILFAELANASLNKVHLKLKLETNLNSQSKISNLTFSDIKNYNYVCTHTLNKDVLVFKTTSPQKIWKTSFSEAGELKKINAFELSGVNINSENIEKIDELASFNAVLAKNYQIRGFFQKDLDGDLPLTVLSSYSPNPTSKVKDKYNCVAENIPLKQVQLGIAKSKE